MNSPIAVAEIPNLWVLEDALSAARLVERVVEPLGAHCALGGGVMKRGFSDKDLDIFIYPHKLTVGAPSPTWDIIPALQLEAGFTDLFPVSWSPLKNTGDQKDVWSCTYQGKRVDLFFLEFKK